MPGCVIMELWIIKHHNLHPVQCLPEVMGMGMTSPQVQHVEVRVLVWNM